VPNASSLSRPSDRVPEASLESARDGAVDVFPFPSSLRSDAGAGAAESPPCGSDERVEGVLRCVEGGEDPPDEP
jgi:hypothetical protein